MKKHFPAEILFTLCAIIGLVSSCTPRDDTSTRIQQRQTNQTTSPPTLGQENEDSGSLQEGKSGVPEDIQQLISQLDAEDVSARIEAARSLYDHAARAAPAVPTLLDRLVDEDAEVDGEVVCTVGQEASIALRKIGEPAFVAALPRLQDADWRMRAETARLLGMLGEERAVAPLIKALRDPEPKVRAVATRSVGLKRDPVALPALVELARVETDGEVLERIPFAISDLEGDSVDELIGLFDVNKRTLSASLVLCLSQMPADPRIGEVLLDLFHNNFQMFLPSRSFAFRQIYRSGGSAELAGIVRSDEYSALTRRWALAAMEGDPLEPELALLSLADRNRDLHWFAAKRLSQLRPPEMADRVFEILEELDDGDRLETLRRLACYLGSTKDARATLPLIAALFDGADKRSGYFMMPRSMIVVFGELNDPRAIDPLLERVNDPSRDVRLAAIHALMQIDDPRVDEIFSRLPESDDSPLPEDLPSLKIEIERKEQAWKHDGY